MNAKRIPAKCPHCRGPLHVRVQTVAAPGTKRKVAARLTRRATA